jgi:hypothetical protein
VIAFGSLEPAGALEACVRDHGEPGSVTYVSDASDLVEGYAEIVAAARTLPELEAVVLARPGTPLGSAGLCSRIRAALEPAGVGIIAAAGARNVQDLRWWTADVVSSGAAHCPAPGALVLAPAALDLVASDPGVPDQAFEANLAWQARARGLAIVVCDLGWVPGPAVIDDAFLAADAWWRSRWSGVGS